MPTFGVVVISIAHSNYFITEANLQADLRLWLRFTGQNGTRHRGWVFAYLFEGKIFGCYSDCG